MIVVVLCFVRFYFALLLIGILLPGLLTADSECPENPIDDKQLTDYEFDLFRWAPVLNNEDCRTFRKNAEDGVYDKMAKTQCSAEVACERVKVAKACLDTFYSDLDDDSPAKAALDENDIAGFDEACEDHY